MVGGRALTPAESNVSSQGMMTGERPGGTEAAADVSLETNSTRWSKTLTKLTPPNLRLDPARPDRG